MKKKILILAGGFSKEREISLKTAQAVNKALVKKKYLTKICEPDGNLIKKIKKFKQNDRGRIKIAKNGRYLYHKHFNSSLVADYIIKKTFNVNYLKKFHWEK